MAHGADVNSMKKNLTPIMLAIRNTKYSMTKLLLGVGADISIQCKTPPALHCAVYFKNSALVSLLLENGCNIDLIDSNNETPLHIAVKWAHESMVELLVTHKANIDAKDKNNYTPLHHAILIGHYAITSFLIQHGVNIEAKSKPDLKTPLFFACEKGREEIVSLLIENGADTTVVDKDGKTLLEVATKNNFYQISTMLGANTTEEDIIKTENSEDNDDDDMPNVEQDF